MSTPQDLPGTPLAAIGTESNTAEAEKLGQKLILAIKCNDVMDARNFLAEGADLSVQDSFGVTAFHAAISSGQYHLIALAFDMLAAGADPHIADNFGYTPLMSLCGRSENLPVIEKLLPFISNINAQSLAQETALLIAAHNNHWDIAEKLLEAGADVTISMPEIGAVMHAAARWHDDSAIRLLLKHGGLKIVEATTGDLQRTPLMAAIMRGNFDNAELLLNLGADPNKADAAGWTALHCAAHSNRTETIFMLARYGADIDKHYNRKGQTPLHLAIEEKMISSMRALVELGADPLKKTQDGKTFALDPDLLWVCDDAIFGRRQQETSAPPSLPSERKP